MTASVRDTVVRWAVVVTAAAFVTTSVHDTWTRWRVSTMLVEAEGHLGLARLERAQASLEEAVRLAPHQAGVHERIGTVASMRYRWRGDEDAVAVARNAFERAVTLNPWSGDLWASFGDALARMDAVEDAMRAYAVALDRDPFNASIHARLGRVLERAGDVDAARAAYREAQRILPSPDVKRLLDALEAP